MRPWSRLFGSKLRLSSPPTARPAAPPLDRSEFDPRSITRTINPDQGDPKSTSVFVSHSSRDKHNVAVIARVLENAGIRAWVDQEAIRGGDKFPQRIHDAIVEADCLILLWSEAASLSDWVGKEIGIALSAHRRIIPCRLDNIALPETISDLHAIDLRSDVFGGLTDLLRTFGSPGPDLSTLREYYREVFGRALAFKLGQMDKSELRIPGMTFRIWGLELIPWKGYSLRSKAGVIAPSRSYIQKSYGGEPEELFRSFLKEEGWSYTPVGTNNRGEMEYRTTTLCKKDKKMFVYAFLAEQSGATEHGSDDWSCRICLLDLNYSEFFSSVIEWTRKRLHTDLLLADDFIVTVYREPRVLRHENRDLSITASFYCDLRNENGFNPWFDRLLEMFLSHLESTGHTAESIGPPPPVFAVHNQETFCRPTQETYLFKVLGNDDLGFYFLYESETNASKSMGYAKISVTAALGIGFAV
jgi:hypothetical protein